MTTDCSLDTSKIKQLLDKYRHRILEVYQAPEPVAQSRFEPDVLNEVISDIIEATKVNKTMKEEQTINDILELINEQKKRDGIKQLYIHKSLLNNVDVAYITCSLERLGYKCLITDEEENNSFLEVWW